MNLTSLLAAGLTLAALALPMGALAQDAAAPSAEPDIISPSGTAGTPAAATPEQNWLKVCGMLDNGKRACTMRQIVLTQNGQFLGALQLRVEDGQEGEPVLMAAVPLGVLLPPRLRLQIDDGAEVGVPFVQCDRQSCIATIVVTDAYVNSLKKGSKLTLTARNRKNEALVITINLAGFTAVYDSDVALTSDDLKGASDQSALQKILTERAEQARQNLQQEGATLAPETPQTAP